MKIFLLTSSVILKGLVFCYVLYKLFLIIGDGCRVIHQSDLHKVY